MAHRVQCWLPGGRGAESYGSEHGRKETQLAGLGTQFGEVEVAGRPDDGVDLLQRRRQHRARHDGEGCLAHSSVLHRVVHQHTSGTADLEGGGIEVAEGAQPSPLANFGRVGEQGGDDDVEQVEHVVLRARLQRPHEGEQRRRASLQRHSYDGLRLGDCREAGKRRHPAWRHMGDGRQAQGQRPHLIKPSDSAGQLGAATKIWAVAQAVERAGTAALAGDQQGIKLRALFGVTP